MPTWEIEAPEPGNEPVQLQDWFVFELPDGIKHAVGSEYRHYGRESRVTSAIQVEDSLAYGAFVTGSGRRYQLVGRPGMNLDGDYVLNAWLGTRTVERESVVDLSRVLWNDVVQTSLRPLRLARRVRNRGS